MGGVDTIVTAVGLVLQRVALRGKAGVPHGSADHTTLQRVYLRDHQRRRKTPVHELD